MRGLRDKVVVIAGGGSGIGAATARRLAEEDARVVIGDLSANAARSVARSIESAGGRATGLAFNVRDTASVARLMQVAMDAFGRLDALHVNAADMGAIREDPDAAEISFELFDRTIAVNLRGHLLCTQQALPHLLRSAGCAIVYTTSESAYIGEPTRVAYAMSKSGLNALMRHVASRWGRHGLRANAVAPGLTLTEEVDRSLDPELRDKSLAEVHSTRLVSPQDVAATVAFLLSDDAASINGQVISVDGGRTMRA
ncbi:MAG: putative oxidoreductase [Steroidobacteraceae bacterium]|nr:putative oxidoreductase [Steroidobacteraceae bacterium]